ncbi:ATP-grasp domain-containing protein [Streptomyces sp. NPDC014735]|uniref:ATP-grasp domain-containing protein n=1 Tax=Streptomyces sp. NPDC014735 TaxID=3364887 RepID=UPI0036F9CB19
MSSRPVCLIVASTGLDAAAYRAYGFASVADAYDVVLIAPAEPTWERPYLTDFEVADPTDQTALIAAGRALAARHQVMGVMTWTEWHLVPAARLARELGLPSNLPAVMHACRNKARSRSTFTRHGVPSAASISVSTPADAAAAAEHIGYPVVLKPAAQAGSSGVIRVNQPTDLAQAYEVAAQAARHGIESTQVLVEEYLDGPEVSAECATFRGTTTAVAVTRKTLGPPPFFEETAHLVDAADPLLATVAPVAVAALRALGITTGISHVEMRLTDSGPRLIEVNARIGGDLIGHLVQLATGVDLPRAAADIACGRAPDLTPTRSRVAGIRFVYPPRAARVQAITVDPEALAHPWCERIVVEQAPGAQVAPPPAGGVDDRLAHLIVTAATPAQYVRRAEQALHGVRADLEVLDAAIMSGGAQ